MADTWLDFRGSGTFLLVTGSLVWLKEFIRNSTEKNGLLALLPFIYHKGDLCIEVSDDFYTARQTKHRAAIKMPRPFMLKLFSGEQLEHLGTVPLFSEPDGTIALTREELEKEIKLAVPKLASLSELSFRDKVQQDIIIPFQSLKRWADGDALDVVVTGTPSFASPKTVLSKSATLSKSTSVSTGNAVSTGKAVSTGSDTKSRARTSDKEKGLLPGFHTIKKRLANQYLECNPEYGFLLEWKAQTEEAKAMLFKAFANDALVKKCKLEAVTQQKLVQMIIKYIENTRETYGPQLDAPPISKKGHPRYDGPNINSAALEYKVGRERIRAARIPVPIQSRGIMLPSPAHTSPSPTGDQAKEGPPLGDPPLPLPPPQFSPGVSPANKKVRHGATPPAMRNDVKQLSPQETRMLGRFEKLKGNQGKQPTKKKLSMDGKGGEGGEALTVPDIELMQAKRKAKIRQEFESAFELYVIVFSCQIYY